MEASAPVYGSVEADLEHTGAVAEREAARPSHRARGALAAAGLLCAAALTAAPAIGA